MGDKIALVATTAAVNAATIGLIVLVGRGVLQGWITTLMERLQQLTSRITHLEDEEIKGLRQQFAAHEASDNDRHAAHASSRKAIHENVSAIRQQMVSRQECEERSRGVIGVQIDLGRIAERIDTASRRMEQIQDRQINQQSGLDKSLERIDALSKRVTTLEGKA